MATRASVIYDFVDRISRVKSKGQTKSLSHNGSVLFSYSTPIARHASADGRRIIEMTTHKYSVTSSKHQNMLKKAARMSGFDIVLLDEEIKL